MLYMRKKYHRKVKCTAKGLVFATIPYEISTGSLIFKNYKSLGCCHIKSATFGL